MIGTACGQPEAQGVLGSLLINVRYHQGRSDEIADLVAQAVDDNPGLPAWAMTLAMLYCDIDRPEDARAVLEPFVAQDFVAIPKDGLWLSCVVAAAQAVVRLAWSDPAQVLFEQLRPFADQIPCPGTFFMLEVNYYLGLLSATLGRDGEAESYFAHAAATHERIGAPFALAMTQLSWGGFLSTRRDPADHDRALSLLRQALEIAQQRDYRAVERRARQAIDALSLS